MEGIAAESVSLQKCHRSDLFEIITIRCLCVFHVCPSVGGGMARIPESTLLWAILA